MNSDQIHLLSALVISGIGFLFLGVANIAFRARRPLVCLASHAMIVAAASAGVFAMDTAPQILVGVSGLLATAMIVSNITATECFQACIVAIASSVRRPVVQAGIMTLGGAVLIGYGMYRFENDLDQTLDNDNAFLEQAVWKPNLHPFAGTVALTDKGHPITLQTTDEIRSSAEMAEMEHAVLEQLANNRNIIRLCGPDDRTNCHGWVFTGGRSWLSTDNIESILEDNGYRPVVVPAVGDLAIYRDSNSNAVSHTAIVRIVSGETPVVESKWGWMGVFLHAVDQSCYGTQFKYYHSDRKGHLLTGSGEDKSPDASTVPVGTEVKIGGN